MNADQRRHRRGPLAVLLLTPFALSGCRGLCQFQIDASRGAEALLAPLVVPLVVVAWVGQEAMEFLSAPAPWDREWEWAWERRFDGP